MRYCPDNKRNEAIKKYRETGKHYDVVKDGDTYYVWDERDTEHLGFIPEQDVVYTTRMEVQHD